MTLLQSVHTEFRPPGLWAPRHWDAALTSCARATGLTLSVYAPEGRRVLGPYLHQPIAKLLAASGAFAEGGGAHAFEQALALQCLARGEKVTANFENALVVSAQPALEGESVVGAVTYGWVYPRFPAPLAAERVSRALGLPTNRFWLASREHRPVSAERMQVYEDLLTALTGSLIEQLTIRRELVKADRMKDEFLSTLSHELRTPLTSVQLRLQTLARILPRDDKRVVQALDAIQSGLRSQTRLISDLLDTSRILTGKLSLELRRVDLASVIARGRRDGCAHGPRQGGAAGRAGGAVLAAARRGSGQAAAAGVEPPRERREVHARGRSGLVGAQ